VTSDITLIIEERQIPAHRFVLASRGTWTTEPLDSVTQIVISEFPYQVMRTILAWTYTDKLDDNVDVPHLLGLLRAANAFKLLQLLDRSSIEYH
jgi:hypothetical protein